MQETPLHPRPQMARAQWQDLCGEWGFAYDDPNVGLDEGWAARSEPFTRAIQVPFPPESAASGIGDRGFHPVVWYRRTFHSTPLEDRRRLMIYFGAVDYRAQVWVNGKRVAEHEGGHTPFWADITTALRPEGEEQVLVVRAEDLPGDLSQPRGKQFWKEKPRSIWYHRTTGIWQPVWLEWVHEHHLEDLAWTPDLNRGVLNLRVRFHAPVPPEARLRVRLSLRGQTLADDTYRVDGPEVQRDLGLDRALLTMDRGRILWSPRYPNLIDAVLTLQVGDRVVDEMISYAGMRGVGFNHGRFYLNGSPYYLRLVLEQGYWPESHLAAPSPDALRREVELIKELGFNGVRIHQKVEDPRFLYWCDRLGVFVWGEMADAYVFSTLAIERLVREWMEVVQRDYSHPCIITWVPINESWGVPNLPNDPAQRAYVQAVYSLTKALDPTRPVLGNDGWEHVASDVWSIHDYALEGQTLRERYCSAEAVHRTLHEMQPQHHTLVLPGFERQDMPVMITEFGGISYEPNADSPWFGYGTVRSEAEFLSKYADLVDAILSCPVIAGFCYTQLTDTEQETNGLLRANREPKFPPHVIHEINRRVSQAVPGDVISNIQAEATARWEAAAAQAESHGG